jgi:Fur family ferric uptake transcriptional regulator
LRFDKHDHFICTQTGDVKEFYDPRIIEIKNTVEKELGVKITHHSLTFYGECNGGSLKKVIDVDSNN